MLLHHHYITSLADFKIEFFTDLRLCPFAVLQWFHEFPWRKRLPSCLELAKVYMMGLFLWLRVCTAVVFPLAHFPRCVLVICFSVTLNIAQNQVIWGIIETPSHNSSRELRLIYLYFCHICSTTLYHLPKHTSEFVQLYVLVLQDFFSDHHSTTTSVSEYVHNFVINTSLDYWHNSL